MITDRAFQCLTCEKSFKLQFHLKRHVPICKKSHEYVSCEDCGKKLVSKRVLKVHKLSCNPNKVYTCSECSSIFDVYSMLVQHRNKEHSKILCDFCDHYCHFSNLKRHIKNNHKGLRPSTARNVVEFQKRKYQCETCENYFFDKSTLNRHQRSHCYQCDLCEKNFKSKQNLEAHKVIHASKPKKSVNWSENMEMIKEIPVSKVSFTPETKEAIMEIQEETDKLLLIYHNRKQNLRIQELYAYIEKQTKKNLSDSLFRAMISVSPFLYKISRHNQELVIEMKTVLSQVTPKTLENRRTNFENCLLEIQEFNYKYIDLICFPEIRKKTYQSAMEILEKNILQFSDNEETDEEHEDDKNLDKFSILLKKVKKKSDKKAKREKKFRKIDWQLKRLPQLARAINNVFISEKKSSIKFKALAEKVGNGSKTAVQDLERLIKLSNGWLLKFRGWVKRKAKTDINDVSKLLV